MLQIESPNIFKGAPVDYNVRLMDCKTASLSDKQYIQRLSRIIKDETGFDPFVNIKLRKREYVMSRQLFMLFLYNSNRGKSQQYTSSFLGKDHATFYHAKKTISNLLDTDREFVKLYNRILTRVKYLR